MARSGKIENFLRKRTSGLLMKAFVLANVLLLSIDARADTVDLSSSSLDRLPANAAYNPNQEIGPDRYPDQQAALVNGVMSQAKAKGYRVRGQRIFIFEGHVPEIGPQWVILHGELYKQFADTYHATEIGKELSVTEPSVSATWQFPGGEVIEVAQSQPLPDGKALVGYFSLTK